MAELFAQHKHMIDDVNWHSVSGTVEQVTGLTVVVIGFPVAMGTLCSIQRVHGDAIEAQVVGIDDSRAVLMTLQDPRGISAGDRVTSLPGGQYVGVGRQMLGAILDGMGRPIGGNTQYAIESHYPIMRDVMPPLNRTGVVQSLSTGIRAIDAMTTVGSGQRMGVFAGTGVGKSVLMGMVARNTSADVAVIALIGERGREVGDFIRKDLAEAGLSRSVLVVSTSDQSPVLRVRAGFVATTIAEYFRDLGNDVLLLMDSTTRLAMAQRQIGLSAGEPPTTKGYPPSVFAMLPQLLERSGRTEKGSITGLYTVLVEGDDINEPISDAVRGILDGHIWLDRSLANRGHYPAMSVLESISRVMPDITDQAHRDAAAMVKRVLATWMDIEDLVNVGAYAPGANVDFDVAVKMKPVIDQFLCQKVDEQAGMDASKQLLLALAQDIQNLQAKLSAKSGAVAPVMAGAKA